ncbi:SCO0930 family lipoprotein [Streptomyces lushanensis]|uniref:SCO0930 family lipoprotein n=1 Tax=Streptomyces lushanensis TaxID=1434255 RepID=UPI000835C07F|nr:SCO0930 family lipoprotein [Streptomyces lushanensis]
MNTWRNASLAVTAAAVLALTTACGQDQGTDTNGQSVGAAKPADAGYGADSGYGTDTGAAAEAKPAGQLAVWDSKELGEVVTDSEGFTLYRFDKDTANPPKSNCEGDCVTAWPVVAAGDAEAAPGTDPSLLGEITRADGTKQLTIAGWPMYRYAQDTSPGDANGQGVGGTWFASAPDGKKAAPAGAASGEEVTAGDLPGLSVRKDPKLGDIVVDSKGMTVYRFKKDTAWPMSSACTGECLEKWPVVAPVDKNDTEGIIEKGYVTFDRPDGIKQQSLDCWPIYTFTGDTKPGDTNGQGVGGTWFAVSPNAKLVGAPK